MANHPDRLSFQLMELAGKQTNDRDAEVLRDAAYALGKGQPTASAFARTQESWATHILAVIEKRIEEREEYLTVDLGWKKEELDQDPELMGLYDDSFFYDRYQTEMQKQRRYIREKWL